MTTARAPLLLEAHRPAGRNAGWRVAIAAIATAMATVAGAAGSATLPPLAHPPVTGALGPFPKAAVTLRFADAANANGFAGSVDVPGKSYPLPDPDEPSDFFAVRVRAVMFADADRKPGNELLILYVAQKTAPQSPAYYAVDVYGWSGQGFVRLRAVEERLEGSRTAADVRRRLRRTPA